MANLVLCLIAGALVIGCPVLLLSSRPQPDGIVLVISLPWGRDAARVVDDAGLQQAAPQRAPMGVLAALTDTKSIDRLYENGAWLVVDGRNILELCVN